MERLTTYRKDGRAAISNNDGATPLEQTMKIPKAIDRLAAYEDTGLEPEEIEKAMDIVKSAVSAFEDFGVDRLAELAQAYREGRCVILPFKPLRWVYMCSARFPKPAQAHYASAINVLQDMDKGCVFGDTPEDAQAALRREQE